MYRVILKQTMSDRSITIFMVMLCYAAIMETDAAD